jgi:DNA helicase-2/ATP-dependent DNA helicase PcrA
MTTVSREDFRGSGKTPTIQLNPAQSQAVESTHDKILALAGPGSGKTRVLVERIKRLIGQGHSPRGMAAITYTNAAADELTERIGQGLGYVGTLHGFCLRLIEKDAENFGFPKRLAVLDEQQADELLAQCAQDLNYRGSKESLRTAIYSLYRQPTRHATDSLVATRFVNSLRLNGLLTFDTILLEALRSMAFGTRPRSVESFSHLFVDEFQDAADIDAEIYRALRIPNQFMVGDPDQSIFAFRGSNVGNITGLSMVDGWQVIRLEQNYRCGQKICEAANKLISQNWNRVDKRTISATDSPGFVTLKECSIPLAEQNYVTTQLMEAASRGQSAAVLLRTNDLVDQWTEFLDSQGVKIARRTAQQRPADWRFVRTAIALFSDPENDWLAGQFISAKHGAEKAHKAAIEAAAAGKSLNAHGLSIPPELPPSAYTSILARCGASQESISIVENAISALPPDSNGADLLLRLAQDENARAEEGRGVTVTTYHSAKGREFDVVFLPAVEQDVIPGKAKSRVIEEERRLFYVGLTRARHHVTITYAKERKPPFGSWKPIPATPSQFISEAL